MKRAPKYRAKPTVVNGRKYASKLEASYAQKLAVLQQAGKVIGWCEQVPFTLPGGIKYRCDFLVFYADGTTRFVETKGFETPEWKLKMRLMAEAHPWATVDVVRRVT